MTADVFMRAASIIRERGATSGMLWNCLTGQVCALGALALAQGQQEPLDYSVEMTTEARLLANALGLPIPQWNDALPDEDRAKIVAETFERIAFEDAP